VGVWVGDGANDRSHVRGRALNFVSIVQSGATIPHLGVAVSASLTGRW
jgi:hypothetical protein